MNTIHFNNLPESAQQAVSSLSHVKWECHNAWYSASENKVYQYIAGDLPIYDDNVFIETFFTRLPADAAFIVKTIQ